MKYSVAESFTIKTAQGNVTLPVGKLLELTQEQATKLGARVRLADMPPPQFRAWLKGDSLRTSGVCNDLATEIVKLTVNNLPLQKKLLKTHVGAFTNPCWQSVAREFVKRAQGLFDGGMGLHEANYQAAKDMHLLAFEDDLGIHFHRPGQAGGESFANELIPN